MLLWFFTRQHVTHTKRKIFHVATQHLPYRLWHNNKGNYKTKKMWCNPGAIISNDSKLKSQVIKVHRSGCGNYEIMHMCYEPCQNKIIRAPWFRYDSSFYTALSHYITPSYRNMMVNLKVENENDIHLKHPTIHFLVKDVKHFQSPL